MNEWKKGLPEKVGTYWFYGYRYGKISCGSPCEPEMGYMQVHEIANGVMHIIDGTFAFNAEVEEAYYIEVELPKPPY